MGVSGLLAFGSVIGRRAKSSFSGSRDLCREPSDHSCRSFRPRYPARHAARPDGFISEINEFELGGFLGLFQHETRTHGENVSL